MTTITLDFETRSRCNLKRAGAPRYAADPSTEVMCLVWKVDGQNWYHSWVPGEPITDLCKLITDEAVTFVAHKGSFEKSIWRSIMVPKYGWPDIPNSRWHDTLAMCAMRAIPQGLDEALRVLRLPVQKDMEGNKLTLAMSKPDRQGRLPDFVSHLPRIVRYCETDVIAQEGLHHRLGWLPPGERDVWLLDQRINERGFHVDMPLVRSMQQIVDKATGPLAAEFADLTGGLSFTQIGKVKGWCHENGLHLPDLQADTLAQALGHSPDLAQDDLEFPPELMPAHVRRALEIRQLVGSASIKKLKAAEDCVMEDDCIRDSLQYHGATPGRWTGRLFMPHNFPVGTIGLKAEVQDKVDTLMTGDPDLVQLLWGPPVETVVSSLRHVINARPGRRIVAGDFAGVELRISMTLSGCDRVRDLLAAGVDVYADMATQIYKRPITKADEIERDIGKHAVLGLDRGMGSEKFRWKYAPFQTEEFCEEVVRVFRKEWAPEIPRMWYGLMDASTTAVEHPGRRTEAYGVAYQVEDEWLTCRLPSGRKLWYFGPTPYTALMPWTDRDGEDVYKAQWFFHARKLGQWRRVNVFGGILMNNIAEGIARDLMTSAMFKCEDKGLSIVLTVHDEIICEPLKNGPGPDVLREIMVDIPDWAVSLGIPISAACWAGERYRK